MRQMFKDVIDKVDGGVPVEIRYDEHRWTTGKAIDADETGIAVVSSRGAHFVPWSAVESINVSLADLKARGYVPK